MEKITLVVAIVGALIALAGFGRGHYTSREFSACVTRVAVLENSFRFMEPIFAKILHSPHRPELDRLLEKRQVGIPLTSDEQSEYVKMLLELAHDDELDAGEKAIAALLASISQAQLCV